MAVGTFKKRNASGMAIMTDVPTNGPFRLPEPPSNTIAIMKMDSLRLQLVGSMNVSYEANRPPATAANPALIANVCTFKATTFFPSVCATNSSSRSAFRVKPKGELEIRNRTTTDTTETVQVNTRRARMESPATGKSEGLEIAPIPRAPFVTAVQLFTTLEKINWKPSDASTK